MYRRLCVVMKADTIRQVWYSGYLPISTGVIIDRYGKPYNVTSVLHQTSKGELDENAYHAYSPIFISASFSITYTVAFGLSTAAIVHTLLHHGPQIWQGLRNRQFETPDLHAKLMRSYSSVPPWYVHVRCNHKRYSTPIAGGFPVWQP